MRFTNVPMSTLVDDQLQSSHHNHNHNHFNSQHHQQHQQHQLQHMQQQQQQHNMHPHNPAHYEDSLAYDFLPDSLPGPISPSAPSALATGGGGGGGAGARVGYAMSDVSSSEYTSSSSRHNSRQGFLIIITFVIESLLLAFVVIIEYFLRWTDVFPLRRQNFTCTDSAIRCTHHEKQLMSDFAFDALVPDEAVYALCFCVPPFVVLIGELGLCSLSEGERKNIRVLSKQFSIPNIVRRLLRFLGVFVFGAFALMVYVDVTKIVIGRLRPDFLHTCRVNESMCSLFPSLDDRACLNKDSLQLRHARTAFPSLNSALTSYAAIYIAVYVHGAMRSHSVRVLRPFLALVFALLAMLCGLAEVSTCVSHWTDVVAGLTLGAAFSLYLTLIVLNQFQEHLSQAEMLMMLRTFIADTYLPYEDKTHLTRPCPQLSSLRIPRVQMTPAPSSSRPTELAGATAKQHQQHHRRRTQDTFQRDLSQSIDYHRRQHPYLYAGSSHM